TTRRRLPEETCLFRTAYAVTLWPLAVEAAQFRHAPAADERLPAGWTDREQHVLTLRLRRTGEAPLKSLAGCDRLRFYVAGAERTRNLLCESLFARVAAVLVFPDGRR